MCEEYRRGYSHGYMQGLIIAHDRLNELIAEAGKANSREGFFWIRMGRTYLWELLDRMAR